MPEVFDARRLRLRDKARRVLQAVPGLEVLFRSIRNYILHQSGTQAGSVAFSVILSMFPALLLVSALAAYLGSPGDAAALVSRVLGYAPAVVRNALHPVVQDVISQRNEALVSIGLFVTLWTASSGMQAIRTALNRAYGVERGMSFWQARLKVIAFTAVVGSVIVFAFSTVVVRPYVIALIETNAQSRASALWLHEGTRYGGAYLVVLALYTMLYGWLPDIRQRTLTVLPGALIGAAMWVGAAALLSTTLRNASQLSLVYGGFTGLVATLVFLYVSASTLIFGAELNGVLRSKAGRGMPSS